MATMTWNIVWTTNSFFFCFFNWFLKIHHNKVTALTTVYCYAAIFLTPFYNLSSKIRPICRICVALYIVILVIGKLRKAFLKELTRNWQKSLSVMAKSIIFFANNQTVIFFHNLSIKPQTFDPIKQIHMPFTIHENWHDRILVKSIPYLVDSLGGIALSFGTRGGGGGIGLVAMGSSSTSSSSSGTSLSSTTCQAFTSNLLPCFFRIYSAKFARPESL